MATTPNPITSEAGAITQANLASRPDKPEEVLPVGWKWVFNETTGVWEIQQVVKTTVTDGDGPGRPAKPADPYAPIMRSFFSAYFKIWGTLPPPGYVESAARSMNLYEFIDQERKKPAFRHTKAYKNDAAKFAALRDQLLGYY